jgi:hypothetical protein
MSEKSLRTYDIGSYEIELNFSKSIAQIRKKIEKLSKTHDNKSLKLHKDFLKKETKGKTSIQQLVDNSKVHEQRINRAVENKLKKLAPKKNKIDQELKDFISNINEQAEIEKNKIRDVIKKLELDRQTEIDDINSRHQDNIQSYIQKLNIYLENFENNKQQHNNQVEHYLADLEEKLNEINLFSNKVKTDLDEHFNLVLSEITDNNASLKAELQKTRKTLDNKSTEIRKLSNVELTEISKKLDNIKDDYKSHYSPLITNIERIIENKKNDFFERESLIKSDLEMRVQKLEHSLENLDEDTDKKTKRNLKRQIDLFKHRSEIVLRYEQRVLDQELLLLEQELREVNKQYQLEMKNLEKLRVFLVEDVDGQKQLVDHLKNITSSLKEHLNQFEDNNNDYIKKHEKLKADFIKEYTKIFAELKKSTIEHARTYLDVIATNNQEIDEILSFMDTAEPLKEIEVNKIHADIEINEVKERYNIKIAAQKFEIELINLKSQKTISEKEIEIKEKISEYNNEIAKIYSKQAFDKEVNKAQIRFKKAQLLLKLRETKLSLERRLLKSNYETEVAVQEQLKLEKELTIRRDSLIYTKELENSIKDLKLEISYQSQVIQRKLDESLHKLEEQIAEKRQQKESLINAIKQEIKQQKLQMEQNKENIEKKYSEQLQFIETALEREIKQPTINKIKMETIIDERIKKFDQNNESFANFISTTNEALNDKDLSVTQVKNLATKLDSLNYQSMNYISRTFEILVEAINYVYRVSEHEMLSDGSLPNQTSNKKTKILFEKRKDKLTQKLQDVKNQEKKHREEFSNLIIKEVNKVKNGDFSDKQELLAFVDVLYNKLFHELNQVQISIKQQTINEYSTLTTHDTKLIEYANKQAIIAKKKLLDQKEIELAPFKIEFSDFEKQKNKEIADISETFESEIFDLRNKINDIKKETIEKIKNTDQDQKQEINMLKEKLASLQEDTNVKIEKALSEIDINITHLKEQYEITLQKLEDREIEAKKIFDYEDKIYKMALESAKSHYNDSLVKANNIHLKSINHLRTMIGSIQKNHEKKITELQDSLKDKTKTFENNIYSVRPKLEESIIQAQKEIDKKLSDKSQRLHYLEAHNQELSRSAETALYRSYQDGSDKLKLSLLHYIDKYRLIEEEYREMNKQINDLIHINNDEVGTSLITLHEEKHNIVLTKLQELNKTINWKEE